MEEASGDSKSSVRRKGSVKCTLKTKTAPHGFSAQRRRPDAKSPRLVTGDDLQTLLAGLRLRRMEQKTDGESSSSPEVLEDAHLHTPATWKEKFSRQMSAGDALKERSPSPTKALLGARTAGTVHAKSTFPSIAGARSIKPVPAKKPATMSKITGKTMLSAFDGGNSNNADENAQNVPPKVLAKPGKVPVVKSKTLTNNAQLKDNAIAAKPKMFEKPQVGLSLKNNDSKQISKSASESSLVSLPVPCPGRPQAHERSPSPTIGTSVSPSRSKTLALKAMFESPSPEATVTIPTSTCKSPNRSPKVARRFENPTPLLPNVEKSKPTPETKRLSQECIQNEENERNLSKKSSRSSDSSAYDDVVVGVESGSSDGEGDAIRVRCRRAKDIVESDSGRGSTVSTDDTGTVTTTEGDSPWSEWVDENPQHPPQIPYTRQRSKNNSYRHSTDINPKRSRRNTAPKPRFWSNPERTLSVTSHTSGGDYDDVVLPQEDENDWETDSETSEMDRSASQQLETTTSSSQSHHSLSRSLNELNTVTEDDVDGPSAEAPRFLQGGGGPPPLAPPRGASTTSRPLPARPTDIPRTASFSRTRDSPRGSPRDSPRGSPRSSPIPRICTPDDERRKAGRPSTRRPRRKVSLDSSIPPPNLGLSRSREGSGHSDCSGSSADFDYVGRQDPETAPPALPRRRAPGELSKDYPTLPARRAAPGANEQESAPPLPPRDDRLTSVVTDDGTPPPPTPPRQRPVLTKELKPNTIVPLSPEALQAGRKEREEANKPRLPPPRRKASAQNLLNQTAVAAAAAAVAASQRRLESAQSEGSPVRPLVAGDNNNMLAEVPPPPPIRSRHRGDDYVGPDPSLPDAPPPPRDGYLAMGNMGKPNRSPSYRPMESQDDNYIDPKEIDSWPGREESDGTQPPEPFGDLWDTNGGPENNYLTIIPDDMPLQPRPEPIRRHSSHRFIDEPLYQIYHFGAVARDVLDQHRDDDNSDDEDSYSTVDERDIESPSRIYETWEQLTLSKTKSPAEIKNTLQNLIRTSTGVRTLWCEMPEVRETNIVIRMSMEERKFQETLFEIITSEASYLKSLKLLISHFMESGELSPDVVSKRDKHILFSNLVAVHNVSEQFMNELEALWQEDFMLRPASLCDLIARYAAGEFQVYVTYCSNLAYQERKLRVLRNQNPRFSDVLARLERSSLCHGLPMQSFITMPMQRITRFPLLIDAVCKRMPIKHEEYHFVTTALHTFQKLVRQCNEGARQMENLEQMADIDKQLSFKSLKKMAIVSQGRFLVKKGSLTHLKKDASGIIIKKKKEQLYLYLFNDILIITKKKGDDNFQVLDYASRINCHAESVETGQLAKAIPHGVPANCSNVFVMALLENHQKQPTDFYFTCDSPSERMRWVEAVAPAQQVNSDERIYEAWACPQVQTIYRYVAAEPDELSLEEADIVNVFRKMADGWYEGERIRDGQRGWFPANHTVEIVNERVRARNLLQRYRLLTLHTQAGAPPGASPEGQQGVVRLESSMVSTV